MLHLYCKTAIALATTLVVSLQGHAVDDLKVEGYV